MAPLATCTTCGETPKEYPTTEPRNRKSRLRCAPKPPSRIFYYCEQTRRAEPHGTIVSASRCVLLMEAARCCRRFVNATSNHRRWSKQMSSCAQERRTVVYRGT